MHCLWRLLALHTSAPCMAGPGAVLGRETGSEAKQVGRRLPQCCLRGGLRGGWMATVRGMPGRGWAGGLRSSSACREAVQGKALADKGAFDHAGGHLECRTVACGQRSPGSAAATTVQQLSTLIEIRLCAAGGWRRVFDVARAVADAVVVARAAGRVAVV
jgi:hypothetical protein